MKSTKADLANVLWAGVREMKFFLESESEYDPKLGARILAVAAAMDELRGELERGAR
jgi:hypothetical protein